MEEEEEAVERGSRTFHFDLNELYASLRSSSTTERLGQLHLLAGALTDCEISNEDRNTILHLLWCTYPRYEDRQSQRAVQECLKEVFNKRLVSDGAGWLINELQKEASKTGIAPANAFVLVEWCAVLIGECARESWRWDKWAIDLLAIQASALEICVGKSARRSLRTAALMSTRRCLRTAFSMRPPDTRFFQFLLKTLGDEGRVDPPQRSAVFLGELVEVCYYHGPQCAEMISVRSAFYGFYIECIVRARAPVPAHIAGTLGGFFRAYSSSASELQDMVLPAMEKALRRAPEVVLKGVTQAFVESIPERWVSEILQHQLLSPLLSNIKSTNPAVRNGAASTLEVAARRCVDKGIRDAIADEIIGWLKSPTTAGVEQRPILARMLAAFPDSEHLAHVVPVELCRIAGKEANEAALAAETLAISTHLWHGLGLSIPAPPSVIATFVGGLGDKKPAVRRIWALSVGAMIWRSAQEHLRSMEMLKFVKAMLPELLKLWTDVVSNPLPALQTGLITAAYVILAVRRAGLVYLASGFRGDAALRNIGTDAFPSDHRPSFLLNHRIYTKLQQEEDLDWFRLAIWSGAHQVERMADETAAKDAWVQAFVYLITSSVVKRVGQRARQSLKDVYLEDPEAVGQMIIRGLWKWRQQIELAEKDSPAMLSKTGLDRAYLVLQSICLPKIPINSSGESIPRRVLENQLAELIIICRPEVFPHTSWIGTCQRMGFDPGEIARKHSERLLEHILEITQVCLKGGFSVRKHLLSEHQDRRPGCTVRLREAALNAAAELAFVAPEIYTPLLIRQIQNDLNPERLANVGPEQAAIYRTPEGTAFVDVLAQKDQTDYQSGNEKDRDILQWEADLRKQLAEKKGGQRKLTKEEQSRVEAQLTKESAIRAELADVAIHLERGYGLIRSLAFGPPTPSEQWMWPALSSILASVAQGSGLLMGHVPFEAYIACSEKVTARLGTARKFIGSATLRPLHLLQVPSEYEQEPLGDQVSRVLYRLKLTAEQRPLDLVSFLFTLPLLFTVLKEGGIGKSQEDADVHVILALEMIALHVQLCANEQLPRSEMISVLITSMQRYTPHYKTIKEGLLGLCKYASVNLTKEEVKALLKGLVVPETAVRTCVLQAIDEELELTDYTFLEEIWLASYDEAEENAELAETIWEANALKLNDDSPLQLMSYLQATDGHLRRSAARSLAAAVDLKSSSFAPVLAELQSLYAANNKPLASQHDPYRRQKNRESDMTWESRSGVALAFKELSVVFDTSHLSSFLTFLVEEGPLGDRNEVVRKQMIDAAKTIIATSGRKKVEELMEMFESHLRSHHGGSKFEDHVREAVVILYGALARHLKSGDARLPQVMERLFAALETPSEPIQYAVAECLPPLVRASGDSVPRYVEDMLDKLMNQKTYAARRGAAYGLAGIVLGQGISALRRYAIMSKLQDAIDNKKNAHHRQGALFAYELLSFFLGRTFEPYTIKIVPQLLSTFGDTDTDVREACLDTAKTCFASLSSYGVKQILPPLLEGLDETQWRSKKGACDLLGAMAYLDPEQLAQSLPEIIPALTNVLADSHKEVRSAAKRSLQRFGDVISNPEMKGIVSILLKAISDPVKHTDDALDSLIKVSFVHYLDAPSLALVVRILERGLGDRSATKRKSSQVIGSLAHLTERKDLMVHLRILVGGLRTAISDPVPTTRATASKALGSLIEKLGEDTLPDLIPSLMATLKSDTGAGDRLGSAQALSEVLAGLGTGRLEETLPTILQNASSSQPTVREGFMTLFIYLPACFGNSFAVYLNKIIPPVLNGLADEVESIRETALRAGRLLVRSYATRAVDLLLPELERGLGDDSYRIRLSSVELVGDLLFTLTGKSGNVDQEEAEEETGDTSQSLVEVLGEEKRARVLSLLYICRCDTSLLVRNAAIAIWKVMVASPKVLKELVPTLTQIIIRRLASSNMEHKIIAGNALGELIRKVGEGLLPTLLPMLEDGLHKSTDRDAKQGICIALRELIASAPPEILREHEEMLASIVRTALVDDHQDVRDSAAEAFDSLQRIFGKKAIDRILPHLLELLRQPDEEDNALAALLTLLTDNARSNLILPNLLPTLLKPPISTFNASALASLSQVAGPALTRRLPQVLETLIRAIVDSRDDDRSDDLRESFNTILLSVDEYDGLNTAMNSMIALTKNPDHRIRAAADNFLGAFFQDAEVDYSRYYQHLIRVFLISFDDGDEEVVKAASMALTKLTQQLKKEEMETLVVPTRQVLQGVGLPGVDLPGFCLPKGINAILPIFLQGLLNGTPEQRKQAALGISDVVDRTSSDGLKPFVTQITGPLIRVVSERSTDVREAILLALNNLLEKIPVHLKAFLPQLQRTFAKSLADPNSGVIRTRAAKALGTLIMYTPRVDPLITELVTGSKTATDPGVKEAMLKALCVVVSKAGKNMSEASRVSIFSLIDTSLSNADDDVLNATARLLGTLMTYLPDADKRATIKSRVLVAPPNAVSVLFLNAILLESPHVLTERYLTDTVKVICQGIPSKNNNVADHSILAAGKFLLVKTEVKSFDMIKAVIEGLATVLSSETPPDTRRLALVVIRTVSRKYPDLNRPHLGVLVPPIFASVRDTITPVKVAAEAAFLAVFSVDEQEQAVFDKYMAGAGADLPGGVKRNMQEYFKRVYSRSGGRDSTGVSAEDLEDEQEVWSVGKVDIGYFGAE